MRQKINSAKLRFQREGIVGLLTLYPNRILNWIKNRDDFWGWLIELRGNKVNVEDLEFLIDIPNLTKKEKAKFLFDRYERPERICIRKYLDPSLPVIELGGNIGVVSCVINKKLQKPENHIVVEANPELIPFLKRNREHNKCQFQIINRAVAHDVDLVTFNLSDNTLGSSIQIKSKKTVSVHAITLETLLKEYKIECCTIVCDIEGAELDLIEHEAMIIRERVSTIIVETHAKFTGQDAVNKMIGTLQNFGFEVVFNRWSNIVLQNKLLK